MAQNITLLGANYSAVPAVTLPKTGGGTATFTDVTDTTAAASDVASGKYFYLASGTKVEGTASGGVNAPTFTMVLSDSTGDLVSTTCDKTVNEVNDIINDDGIAFAYVKTTNEGETYEYWMTVTDGSVTPDGIFYYFGGLLPGGKLTYAFDGTITVSEPDNLITLTVTSNGTYTPSYGQLYNEVVVNVPSSGSSKNAQTAQSTTRSTSTSYTEVISLICDKSGTYDVYWSTFRSSTSGTWGSQLYLNNSAYGSAQTGSWSNHIQNIHLQNVQIDANEEVAVRVRSRGSNYYGYVGTLTIIEV